MLVVMTVRTVLKVPLEKAAPPCPFDVLALLVVLEKKTKIILCSKMNFESMITLHAMLKIAAISVNTKPCQLSWHESSKKPKFSHSLENFQ